MQQTGWIIGLLIAGIAMLFTAHPAQAQTECPTSLAAGEHRIALRSSDYPRSYLVYIPELTDTAQPVPILISLHGFASNAEQQRMWSGFNALADEFGFIAVYLQGAGFVPRWNNGTSQFQPVDSQIDVIFFDDLLADLAGRACFDESRVYVTGFSAGGGMAHRLACERAERVAGIGTVAAAISELPEGCNPSRPVPLMHFHGAEDRIVPIGGEAPFLPDIGEWIEGWAERNECRTDAESELSAGLRLMRYEDCAGDAAVIYYAIAEGGHTWPGGNLDAPEAIVGATTDEIDASRLLWEFLSQFSLEGRIATTE